MTQPAPQRDSSGRLLPKQVSLNPNGRPRKGTGPNVTLEQKVEHDILTASRLTEAEQAQVEVEAKRKQEENSLTRDSLGRFISQNNPGAGRKPIAKGGKMDTVTLARRYIATNIHKVLEKLLEQAEAGDTTASKLLLDRYLPTLKASEIHITDRSQLPRMVVQANVIDAEVIESTGYRPAPPSTEID